MNRQPWFKMLAVSAAVALACTGYAADEQQDEAKDKDENKITVVGSRIKRSQIEGAQPVIVIDQDTMKERGYVTVFEALDDLTQNNGIQIEGPEFSGGFSPDVQTLNLRGFGVGTTLMLVNGRRLAAYPAAYQSDTTVSNYGAIPAAAVERIEILTTGASAIYGSDAVAGVINIVLRDDYEGTTINYLHGWTTESNKNTDRVQFLTGKNYADAHWMAAFEYQKRDGIYGEDYDQYDSLLDYPYGTGVLSRAVLNLNWWRLLGFAAGDPYVDPGQATCDAMNNGTTYAFRPNRGWFCGYDSAKDSSFRNPSEKYSLFFSGSMQLTDDIEGFGQVLYYTSESKSRRGGLYISENIFDPSTDPTGFFGHDWYLAQRFFTNQELGVDTSTQFEDDSLSVLIGARGTWGDHDWEFVVTHSQYELNTARPWFKAEEVLNVFLGNFLGFDYFGDPWFDGNGSFGLRTNLYSPLPGQVAQQVLGTQTYGNKTKAQTAQFTMTGEMGETNAGPIQYAFVAEFNYQDFDFLPDARIQQPEVIQGLGGSGWWGLTGYNGTGDRTLFAVGLETQIPLTDTFSVNVAGRIDSYDDTSSSIGTRFTPQLSFEWRPVEELLVRGGYAGSFRAPDLQMVYTETGFYTGATDFVQCYETYIFQNGSAAGFDPADCDSSSVFVRRTPATKLDANTEPLEDETGHNVYLGIVLAPTENLSVSATVSETTLKNIARVESIQQLLDDEFDCFLGNLSGDRCTYVSNRINRQVDPNTNISFISTFNASPINTAEERVKVVDMTGQYRWETEIGQFAVRLDWSHTLEHTAKDNPGDEERDLRDDVFVAYDFRSRLTGSLQYRHGDFTATLTGIRNGSSPVWRPSSSDDSAQRLGPFITYNFTAQYNVSQSFQVGLRVTNLFNKFPPEDDSFLFYEYPWYNYFMYGGAGIGREAAVEFEYSF